MSRQLNILAIITICCGIGFWSESAEASFITGDIFASYGNGKVGVYDSSGAFKQLLDTGTGSYETGSVSDTSTGNFYVTDFGASSVSTFDNSGTLLGTFGSSYSTPEDIAHDAAGNFFVSDLGGTFRKYSSTGTLLQSWTMSRIDWFDLSADEHTLFYTDESGAIHRYDLVNDVALPDFASSGGQYALRLLSNGDVLAAASGAVTLFDSSGNAIRTYNPGASSLFAMNIDPGLTSFITGDINTGNIYRYDIASGALLQTISTAGPNNNDLWGLSIYGEATVTNPGNPVPEPGTIALLGIGLLGISLSRKSRAE